ncbi:dolichyl-phosphate-mannose--protein mannosyltransferase [Prauserella marina]|uniref:Polyprenol-phosphate-mannose--protein mannosyltransferase n=1 Tax=Prauserella marina TaxID=530584 RepID=A0A222VVW0_9PSEU|nr:phospholipid carrier-dependent glycosyltransferase [Prauserella marina]ASR38068.1 dolichyl-phosphate-mannose--protein mannosyltransferase [Prauserella marina]PWV73313.1 dolichyl-phosphate-mannose-protein mannosyltransferase [Prauserella marina]SDD66615.1 Dolichyl-phosphate-mannose-protein mannosyltransferase [Prauserella marina]
MTALLTRSPGGAGPGTERTRQPPSDREAALLGTPMPGDRVRALVVTFVLTAIAGIVRLQNLGVPTDKGTPVFDEKHYVPQAWQMLRNGGYEDNYGYELVVHPPLAKQLIAIGEWLFGYNGWGWRFSAAVAGMLIVLLTIRIARRLTRSTLLGAVAGVLVICDGVLHLQSRMGMLDIFIALFVLAAFGTLLMDREQVRQRLAVAVREGWVGETPFGPKLGFRWWRFGTGVLLGLATAIKWSGMYWVLAFGLLCVIFDVTARKAAGVARPWAGMLRRDLAPALWSIGAVAVLAYLSTWWAWFASETATDRNYTEINGVADGPFGFVPAALRSLVLYTFNVLDFHESLATPDGDPHPWESKPWTWPMGLRPMLYSYASGETTTGCGESECVRATMLVGTPAMWWLALPVLGWGLWRSIFRADWRYAAVLVGYAAGLLPWFVNLDRQMYFFYATPMAPFLILGLTLVLGQILGTARSGFERRGTGLLVVALYVGLVVANFVWLWPILNGDAITMDRWQAELWLPSWR